MVPFFAILAVGIIGGLVPLIARWSDRQHHSALALSTGVFLGAVFLHLLPTVAASGGEVHDHGAHVAPGGGAIDLTHDHDGDGVPDHGPGSPGYGADAEADDHSGHDHSGHDHGSDAHAGHVHGPVGPWLWVLVGLLGVFVIEALVIPGGAHAHGPGPGPGPEHGHGHGHPDPHSAVGWAALVGLSVHALTAGVALAAVQSDESIAGVMLLAILAHKGFESFSLASVFSMTGASRKWVVSMVVLFSLVTPLGLLLGGQIAGLLGAKGISILTSLSTGTFLYVSLCELLPEIFHRRQDALLKLGLLGAGIAVMWYAHAHGGI